MMRWSCRQILCPGGSGHLVTGVCSRLSHRIAMWIDFCYGSEDERVENSWNIVDIANVPSLWSLERYHCCECYKVVEQHFYFSSDGNFSFNNRNDFLWLLFIPESFNKSHFLYFYWILCKSFWSEIGGSSSPDHHNFPTEVCGDQSSGYWLWVHAACWST